MKGEKWRQRLHLEPPDGWLNDPNGLCFYNGQYHVFFQYSPKSAEGETPRCWGHFEGENLLEMAYDRIVLSPDIPEDKDGVYSGSAAVKDGLLYLFYTGNVKENGIHDYIRSGRGANVICVTSNDGSTVSEKKVLLRNADYPDFCSCHVRDPKVWYEDGKWKMVLGARTADDKGCILVYHSDDLENWSYQATASIPDFGYMWECPDCFNVGGKRFLSVSPQGLPSSETRYQNVYQSGYFALHSMLENNALGEFREWDMGFDFYAPQTFEAPDGRRILIGWMGIGDIPYSNATVSLGWQHCLTLPRELETADNGTLLQKPIRELEALRTDCVSISEGSTVTAKLPFDLCAEASGDFEISLDQRLLLQYRKADGIFRMEFTDENYGCGRTIRRAELSGCHEIRVVADMSSIEVYLNSGAAVLSTRFYPDGESVCLTVCSTYGRLWHIGR